MENREQISKQTSIPSLLKRHKPQLIAGIVALSVVDLLQMAIPLVIKQATDAFVRGGPDAADFVKLCAFYILGMGVAISLFRFGWRYFIMGSARKIERSLRDEFFSHLQRLDISQITSRKVGDLMAHAVNDVETLKFACGLGVLVAYDGMFLLVFIMGAMFYISPVVAAVLCVPFAIMMIFVIKGGREIEKRFRKTQDSFSLLTESARRPILGIKAVKSLRMEETETGNFGESSRHYAQSNIHLARLWAVYQPAISLCVGIAGVAFLLLGGAHAIEGEMTLGDFTALLVYLSMLSWPMMAMGWAQDILRRGNSSIKRLNSILKLSVAPDVREVFARMKGDLQVRETGVSFGGVKILDGCSFTVRSGETACIVGVTGSGKTTLANIISGETESGDGSVLIGGTDTRSIRRAQLKRDFVRVDREAFIFSGTVRENINFMQPRSDEETRRAVEICGMTEEIEGFERGLDSVLGERGINISEGQKQRVSIARSVIFEPAVLILDDALSSVDLSTEAKVTDNLCRWAKETGTALIIISSRTNSSHLADVIMVLDGGKIAERGTHSELVAQDGIYAGMHRIQTR
ncbi:MAG: ATP-binding cassette domain-containing protein [Candidatus Mycalebacterium zealandia]|nr:MAG: ATP-binding cassette domain-containing protein [Candidatus Mycalebacterium zealandia]